MFRNHSGGGRSGIHYCTDSDNCDLQNTWRQQYDAYYRRACSHRRFYFPYGAFIPVFLPESAFSKPGKAVFVREYKPSGSRFSVACYSLNGKEFPCVFPMESAMKSRLYIPYKRCFVMYSKLLRRVYDIWAILTCILGLAFSGFATACIIKIVFL